MSGSYSRDKGQRGEREVIKVLQPTVSKVYIEAGLPAPELARNLSQTRDGGFDIKGLEWMALEVKYQESENIKAWWEQTCRQAGTDIFGMRSDQNQPQQMVGGSVVKRVGSSGKVGPDLIRTPILFYRANREQWQVMLVGRLFAEKSQIRTPVRVTLLQFLPWFELKLREEVAKATRFVP